MLRAAGTEIRGVEIAFATVDGAECEYDYALEPQGRERAEIEVKGPDGRTDRRTNEEAVVEAERVIERMNLHPDLSEDELIERTCEALELDRSQVRRLVVGVEFGDGEALEARLQ